MTESSIIDQLRQGLRADCAVIAWKANVVRALRKLLCYFRPRSPPIYIFYILPENYISWSLSLLLLYFLFLLTNITSTTKFDLNKRYKNMTKIRKAFIRNWKLYLLEKNEIELKLSNSIMFYYLYNVILRPTSWDLNIKMLFSLILIMSQDVLTTPHSVVWCWEK